MNSWRGAVLILASAVGGFSGGMLWLFLSMESMRDKTISPFAALEGLGFLMGGIFLTAQATASVLELSTTERHEFQTHYQFQRAIVTAGVGLAVVIGRFEGTPVLDPRTVLQGIVGSLMLAWGVWGLWVHGRRHLGARE